MNKHEDIAKTLNDRLSELTGRVAEIESELRKPLPANFEERATYLKIRMRSKASGILEFRKSDRLERR